MNRLKNTYYYKYILFFFIILLASFLSSDGLCDGIPAFPGAEGFGSNTFGGRGGRIIEVTNLNAYGPGSFRDACLVNEPRIIVFRIGGIINLTSPISIPKPYVTIAGQTAPGDGICLRGAGIVISTHDVVVRGLRIRVGDSLDGPDPSNRDGITIANSNPNNVYNIIIDHCSVSWSIDEGISTWYTCQNITIQWCIVSEALFDSIHPEGPHSRGMLIGDHSKRITVHHNLFAHNNKRNPLLKGDTEVEVFNNVVYNWGELSIHLADPPNSGPQIADSGNIALAGFNSQGNIVRIHSNVEPNTKIYVKDNVDVVRGLPTSNGDEWDVVTLLSTGIIKSTEPTLQNLSGTNPISPWRAYRQVLSYSGAILPKRDPVDERILISVDNRTGKIINSQNDVGGWPEYNSGKSEMDTDKDGIPDQWELKYNMDPNDANDGREYGISGYTKIEEYLNSLFFEIPNGVPSVPLNFKFVQ